MRIRIYLLAALAAAVLLLFPRVGEIVVHLMAAAWVGIVLAGVPYYVRDWYRYDWRQTQGWSERRPLIKRAATLVCLTMLLTASFWREYNSWWAWLHN